MNKQDWKQMIVTGIKEASPQESVREVHLSVNHWTNGPAVKNIVFQTTIARNSIISHPWYRKINVTVLASTMSREDDGTQWVTWPRPNFPAPNCHRKKTKQFPKLH